MRAAVPFFSARSGARTPKIRQVRGVVPPRRRRKCGVAVAPETGLGFMGCCMGQAKKRSERGLRLVRWNECRGFGHRTARPHLLCPCAIVPTRTALPLHSNLSACARPGKSTSYKPGVSLRRPHETPRREEAGRRGPSHTRLARASRVASTFRQCIVEYNKPLYAQIAPIASLSAPVGISV